ncbi:MAG TPA: hypothetical protein VMC09_09430 [Anaerolineales bacterium]|nr:hypothetical protein [Anaerolineales bacterium]
MNIKFNVRTKIRFNGREYDGVEAMPSEVRKAYDELLAKARASQGSVQFKTSTKVTFNGTEYASPDEMPAEVRSQYDLVMANFDKDHDGIPDMLETGDPVRDSSTLVQIAPLTNKPDASSANKGRKIELILLSVLIFLVGIFIVFILKVGLQ